MARGKTPPFTIDRHDLRREMGKEEFTRQVGPLVKEIPVEEWLAHLTPKQRRKPSATSLFRLFPRPAARLHGTPTK